MIVNVNFFRCFFIFFELQSFGFNENNQKNIKMWINIEKIHIKRHFKKERQFFFFIFNEFFIIIILYLLNLSRQKINSKKYHANKKNQKRKIKMKLHKDFFICNP